MAKVVRALKPEQDLIKYKNTISDLVRDKSNKIDMDFDEVSDGLKNMVADSVNHM